MIVTRYLSSMATNHRPIAFATLHDPLEAELHKQHTEIPWRSTIEGNTKRTAEWVKESFLYSSCRLRRRKTRLRRWRRLVRGIDPLAAAALLPILSQRGPAALRLSLPPTSLPTELLARVRAREQRACRTMVSRKVVSRNV